MRFQVDGGKNRAQEGHDDLNPFAAKRVTLMRSSPKRKESEDEFEQQRPKMPKAYSFLDVRAAEVKQSTAAERKEKYRKLIKKLHQIKGHCNLAKRRQDIAML